MIRFMGLMKVFSKPNVYHQGNQHNDVTSRCAGVSVVSACSGGKVMANESDILGCIESNL